MQLRFMLISLILLMQSPAWAEITEQQIQADCAKIPAYARQGEKLYQSKQYAKARDAFLDQVGWSEQCNTPESDLATAYNNVAMTWIREGEYRKAQAWLMLMPEDRKSVYNLGLIKDKLQPFPATLQGEYWQYAGRGIWETMTVKPLQHNIYQVSFDGYYFGLMGIYAGPNIGGFDERVTLKDGKGVVDLKEEDIFACKIALAFTADVLSVTTDDPQNCGFGHNVSANGEYRRIR